MIGVPTRYAIKHAIPAFKSNWLLSILAMAALNKNYGGLTNFISNPNNLQEGIELARKARAQSLQTESPEDS